MAGTSQVKEKFEDYEGFVEKFKPKLTTDDCITPAPVYEAVRDWVVNEYHLNPDTFLRPFWNGADYQQAEYNADTVVVDNPPFSILSKILDWYCERNIKFFLFCPGVTAFAGQQRRIVTSLCVGIAIEYENGARVNTSFVTNLEPREIRARSAPTLYKTVRSAVEELRREKTKTVPKYSYPWHVATSSMINQYSHYGVDYIIRRDESCFVRELDNQKAVKKAIYGGGFLLSERAAAERAAATVWKLSEREKEIIKTFSRYGGATV